MAPAVSKRRREKSTTRTTKTTMVTRRIVTRSIYKKQQLLMMTTTQEKPSRIVESPKRVIDDDDYPSTTNKSFDDGCSTPKSEKYKIPEIMTCPPAPKKPRVSPSNNCLVQTRRPISFFAHPDIEKFFMFAMRDHIKV